MACGSGFREHTITKEYQDKAFIEFPSSNVTFKEYILQRIRPELGLTSFDSISFVEYDESHLDRATKDDGPVADVRICIPAFGTLDDSTEETPLQGVKYAPYSIKTHDDLLEYMWFEEWYGDQENPPSFDKAAAEQRFQDYVREQTETFLLGSYRELISSDRSTYASAEYSENLFQLNWTTGISASQFSSIADPTPAQIQAYLDTLTVDQQIQLLNEAYGFVSEYGTLTTEDAEVYGYIGSYLYTQMAAEGMLSPFDSYDPNLALNDWYLTTNQQRFLEPGADLEETHIFDLVVALLVQQAYSQEGGSSLPPHELHQNARNTLLEQLGEDFTIDDLMNLAYSLASQFPEGSTDGGGITLMGDYADQVLDQTSAYFDAQALDQLRAIVYDPTWNPAEDEKLLAQLFAEISKTPRAVLGVPIEFVQDSFLAYYDAMKKAHDWRIELKKSIDRIEVMMAERADQEQEPLWWLLEIPLSILVEPLDWLFTTRDLLQGDMTALIGFLPLVPAAVRKIVDAGKYALGAGGDAAKRLGKIIEWQGGIASLEQAYAGGLWGRLDIVLSPYEGSGGWIGKPYIPIPQRGETGSLWPERIIGEAPPWHVKLTRGGFKKVGGIYEYRDLKTGKWYVGKSDNLRKRLTQHVTEGELSKVEDAVWIEISGNRRILEAAEHTRISQILNELGGEDTLESLLELMANKKFPLGAGKLEYWHQTYQKDIQAIVDWPVWLKPPDWGNR